MKIVKMSEFGSPDVLKLTAVETPTPKENEVRVRIHATSVGIGDLMARRFSKISPGEFSMPFFFWLPARFVFGLRKPKITTLGSEYAGVIEAVGGAVTKFKVGDAVFGFRGATMGANAEYLCVAENGLIAHKPTNLNFEEACTVPYGALTALTLLRKLNIQPGQKVLVHGASGGIGSAAVQLAKYFGAHVTGVCSTPRVELVKALGADVVIDYTREDFTKNGQTYDLIFDIMNKISFAQVKNSLTPNGRLFYASFKMKQVRQMLWTARRGGKKVVVALSNETPADLVYIKGLVEAGTLKAIVDRCFPLERAADAHRYLEQGKRTGSVVITVA